MTQQLLFQREILIDAPLNNVWPLVGTEEGLRQWWGNTIYFEAKEGGRCEEWRPRHGVSTHWRGVVTIYAPPHQLMLTLQPEGDQTEAPEMTTIAITLDANGEQTRVHVSQRAFGPSKAIAPQEPKQASEQPAWRQDQPLAQLQRPAPGTLPLPALPALPAGGRIDPTYRSITQPQLDALSQSWQSRLTALTAALQSD